MKSIIVLFLLGLVVSGCPEKTGLETNQDVKMVTISKGILHGAGEEGIAKSNLVINNSNDWDELVSKLDKVNKITDDFKELPVDFSQEMVVACFDRVMNSGGYTISIDSVMINKENLKFTINRTAPGPTDFATMSITQPYHIIKIIKTNKNIEFIEQ